MRCELDRETPTPPASGMNQDGLASANVQPTVQRVIRGEAGAGEAASTNDMPLGMRATVCAVVSANSANPLG